MDQASPQPVVTQTPPDDQNPLTPETSAGKSYLPAATLIGILLVGGGVTWFYLHRGGEPKTNQSGPAGAVVSARDTERKANLRNLATKCEEYLSQKGSYPATLDELVSTGYLQRLPTDPSTDAPYVYETTGSPPQTFTLSATLENSADSDGPVFTVTGG